MSEKPYHEALTAFTHPEYACTVETLAGGLINHSYKVTSHQTGVSFLLQEINRHIFPEPGLLQQNYETLFRHLETAAIPMMMPAIKYFPGNAGFYTDRKGRHWRVFEFIDGTKTHGTAKTLSQASETALCFARFTSGFHRFDISQLHIIIPGFHHLSKRFRQFSDSLKKSAPAKQQGASVMIDELTQREKYAHLYDVLTDSESFRLRVMHHDAKISNVLFDVEEDMVVCPVDFDTVMPGYIFSDLGDMIRSMAARDDENGRQPEDICIRGNYYHAIVSSYLLHMEDRLSEAEKKYIHFSGIVMIYMQSLRYLTDHLDGDTYYRVEYEGQNLDRAMNQLALLRSLEEFLNEEYGFSV